MKTVTVNGTFVHTVEVNPLDVLKKINPIPADDWIVEKDGKYIQMTEEDYGHHSHSEPVGEVSKEIYEVYMAKKTLIQYLKNEK